MHAPLELEALFTRLAAPTAELEAEVSELIQRSQGYEGAERRRSPRFPIALPVVAVPIDDSRAAGEAFAAVSRDISAKGMSIYHTHPVYEPYLAVQWTTETGDQFRVLLEVVRCRSAGPFFYELAGTFITQPE